MFLYPWAGDTPPAGNLWIHLYNNNVKGGSAGPVSYLGHPDQTHNFLLFGIIAGWWCVTDTWLLGSPATKHCERGPLDAWVSFKRVEG